MHTELASVLQRWNAPPDMAAELQELFDRRPWVTSAVTTMLDDYDSVDLDSGKRERREERDGLLAGRFQDLGPLGRGGMGEVRRVRDVELNRTLAMKIVHASVLGRPRALARFVEEAQATAQLQHPNIVPIHDVGTLADGRIWFTMREIRGRTLTDVTREVHAAADFRWNPGAEGWTFRRMMASFLAVCHAMAYAHERGVVHRDLKPDNVMVGRHGETYVVDWGLAKVIGREHRPIEDLDTSEVDLRAHVSGEDTIVTGGSDANRTRIGTVAGTPAYMAPEQALGDVDKIDERTDVYQLGAMLYEILAGRRPYTGRNSRHVLAKVLAGPPPPLVDPDPSDTFESVGPPLPPELVAACERAMTHDRGKRFPSALALAAEIEAWLDGARKREQALEITERALAGVGEASRMLARASELEAEGDALLEHIEPWRPAEDKTHAWALQDEAAALRRSAELAELGVDQGLHGALRVAPDLPEAHAALADRYLARHRRAEAARAEEEVARNETLLELHVSALPESDETRRSCVAYLEGTGAVTLVTEPAGAEVELFRYEVRDRRLVEVEVRSLGQTPVRREALPMGSYLAVIRHPGCADVRYPFEIPRQGHWSGVAPGDREPTPIWLPPTDFLGPDEVYVPAGWFHSGGDPQVHNGHPAARHWCDALVVQRFPVTNRQYIAFLDDLVALGRTDEALRHAPRERPGVAGELGALIYGFDGTRFSLVADADGDLWRDDWPVMHVDWEAARAWLAWQAERTGRPWRLAHGLEWEKAARGVDGRWYPWGDHSDPSWYCMTDSHRDRRLPAPVDSYPTDVSPYGVRGMAGNVEDWVLDTDGPRVRTARGGSWNTTARNARLANRDPLLASIRLPVLGFRGVYRPDQAAIDRQVRSRSS